jgi:hypothetical protein
MKVVLILIQFEYVTDKLVTESEEILVYFNLFSLILFYNVRSNMTGEHDTRDSNHMEGSSQR